MFNFINIQLIARFLKFRDINNLESTDKHYYSLFRNINFKSIIKTKFKIHTNDLEYGIQKRIRCLELSKRFNFALNVFRRQRIPAQLFSNFYKLKLNRIKAFIDLEYLKHVKKLELNNCRHINLNDFEDNTIEKLEIHFYKGSQHSHNQKIDLNSILNIPKLLLFFNNTTYKFKEINLDLLKNNQKITICESKYFNQVHKFKYLNFVECIGCESITDISMLYNVHTIRMVNCKNLQKLGSLTNVKVLDVQKCYKLNDLTGTENIELINLTDCHSIIDLSPLKKVKALAIGGCFNLRLPEGYFGNDPIITNSMRHLDINFNNIGNKNILKPFDFLENLEYLIDDANHCICFMTMDDMEFYSDYTIHNHYKKCID